jgi:DNA repair exonuclease SbcCD ATPase subunit
MFKSPPKLRKFSAVSDADTDGIKQKSHARSQSATVGRPSTAPESQEQKLRDMRIMGDLLREANVREAMKQEITELKAEVERLQRPKSPVKPDTWAGTFTVAEMEEMEASHLEEVQGIRKDYETQRRATEEEHAIEMRNLKAELDQMDSMKAEHAKVLATAHAKLEAESKELRKTSTMLKDLKNTHAKELQESSQRPHQRNEGA